MRLVGAVVADELAGAVTGAGAGGALPARPSVPVFAPRAIAPDTTLIVIAATVAASWRRCTVSALRSSVAVVV
ncbi:MAG TPA: hypothetical protein VFC99_01460 [Acidimicrobiia bacterium]|nr:hypothetical protein [Acidimicrobiia bacterium]